MERVETLNEKVIVNLAKRERKLTQIAIAEKMGMKQNALSAYMLRKRMSLEGFGRIMKAMDYDIVIVDRNSGKPVWQLEVRDPEDLDDDI